MHGNSEGIRCKVNNFAPYNYWKTPSLFYTCKELILYLQ